MPITIEIPGRDLWNEQENCFETVSPISVEMEHSLASLSKWEQKHEKAFLGHEKKTAEETFDYFKAMVITPNFPMDRLDYLTEENFEQIQNYIEAKMTATTFRETPDRPGHREKITAEIIYYWMNALNIPLEWENRHLSALFTMIKVVNAKNAPQKKRSRREVMDEHRSLNEQRRAAAGQR
jgi:hypothetical protein